LRLTFPPRFHRRFAEKSREQTGGGSVDFSRAWLCPPRFQLLICRVDQSADRDGAPVGSRERSAYEGFTKIVVTKRNIVVTQEMT
jgi:hypothetical protein